MGELPCFGVFSQQTLGPNSVESPGHVRAIDGDLHAAIGRKEPRHREVGQRVPRSTAFGMGELLWSKSICATDVRLNQREHQTLGNLRQLGSQVCASAVAGRENFFFDRCHPMYTPRLRPRSCLHRALQQGLHRLGQLPRTAFEDACRDEGGAVFAETSRHSQAGDGRLEVKALGTLCVGVALSRKLVGEKVSLPLRIQHPSALAGLERRHAADLGFAFRNFLCLLPPQLGSRPKTTHLSGRYERCSRDKPQQALRCTQESFPSHEMSLLLPAWRQQGPRNDHSTIDGVVSGIHDLAERRMAVCDPLGRSGRGLVSDVIPTCVSMRVLEPLPVVVCEQPHLALGHDL